MEITDINWESLNEEKRNELRKINQNIDKIFEFQGKVNQKLMIYIFGERLGNHYWDKFVREYSRNMFQFMNYMDSSAKSDLMANIFLDENLYSNCY
jgi:hypothetical protein